MKFPSLSRKKTSGARAVKPPKIPRQPGIGEQTAKALGARLLRYPINAPLTALFASARSESRNLQSTYDVTSRETIQRYRNAAGEVRTAMGAIAGTIEGIKATSQKQQITRAEVAQITQRVKEAYEAAVRAMPHAQPTKQLIEDANHHMTESLKPMASFSYRASTYKIRNPHSSALNALADSLENLLYQHIHYTTIAKKLGFRQWDQRVSSKFYADLAIRNLKKLGKTTGWLGDATFLDPKLRRVLALVEEIRTQNKPAQAGSPATVNRMPPRRPVPQTKPPEL